MLARDQKLRLEAAVLDCSVEELFEAGAMLIRRADSVLATVANRCDAQPPSEKATEKTPTPILIVRQHGNVVVEADEALVEQGRLFFRKGGKLVALFAAGQWEYIQRVTDAEPAKRVD